MLHQLSRALETMISELEYRLTPLPELCRCGGQAVQMPLQSVFIEFAESLQNHVFADVYQCMDTILKKNRTIPAHTAHQLHLLGQTLGKYDLPGQLRGLSQCRQECLQKLKELEYNQQQRLRSYQTLGFCAGAALAILLL